MNGSSAGPRFAVVVPAYNAEATLTEAVRSGLAQTERSLELIIVDDGSRDGTAGLASELARADDRVEVVSQENNGLAGARNSGIAASSAPYLAFLDADDMLLPRYLEAIGHALDSDSRVGIAYTEAWTFDRTVDRIRRTSGADRYPLPQALPEDPEELLIALAYRNFMYGVRTVRREAFEEAGVFDPDMRLCEDYELALRVVARGWRVVRPPELLAIVSDRPGSLHYDELGMARYRTRICRRLIDDPSIPAAAKAEAATQIEEMEAQEAILSGGRPARALLRAVRLRLGAARRRLLPWRFWYREPPPEVRETLGPALERPPD